MRAAVILTLVVLQLFAVMAPAGAASFDSKTIKISVDETLWEKYHMLNPATASGDVEKIYKIKSIEGPAGGRRPGVRLLHVHAAG